MVLMRGHSICFARKNKNTCCDQSIEQSQGDSSKERPQHIFFLRKMKNQPLCPFLSAALQVSFSANHTEKKQLPGLPLIIHFKIPCLFPDFSLPIYGFPYPLTDKKKSFLFFTLMVLTVSLQIWGLLLKEKIRFLEEQILSFKSSPQCGGKWAQTISGYCASFSLLNRINKFSEDCLPQPFIFEFPDFSPTFRVLSKFP